MADLAALVGWMTLSSSANRDSKIKKPLKFQGSLVEKVGM
jgi:hypothetical protein